MQHTRVLVADDNRSFGTVLSRFVGAQSDLDVVGLAGTGSEALTMAASLQPDVVLMDLYMPETDGFEATRRVRLTDPRIKVIALTAHGSDDNERLSFAAGASAFMRKSEVDRRLIGLIHTLTTPGPTGTDPDDPGTGPQ